jgi:TolA-binding protein
LRRLIAIILMGLALFACGTKKAKVVDEEAFFAEAQNFEKTQDYAKAVESYQSFIDNYPQSPVRYKAIFMAGYIQMEYLKNNQKAAELFQSLLKEYPNCDLADDAKVMYAAAASGKDLMSVFQDSLKGK